MREVQLKQQQLLVQRQQNIEKQQLEEKRQKWQQQQQYAHNNEQEVNTGYNKTCSSSEYMQQQQHQNYDPTLTPSIMSSNMQPPFSSVNMPQPQQNQAHHNKQANNFSLPPQSQHVRLRKPLQKAASQMSLNQPTNQQQQQRQIQQLQQQQVIRRSKQQQQQQQQPNQRKSMFSRLDSDDEFDKLVEINYKEIVHPIDDIGIGRSSGVVDNVSNFRQPQLQHLQFQSQQTQYNETNQSSQQQQQNLQRQQPPTPTDLPEVRLRQPLEVMDSGDEIGGKTVMDKANQWDVAIEQKINKQKQLQQLEGQKKVKKHHSYQQPPQQLRNVDASGMVHGQPYQQQMQQHPQMQQQYQHQHPQHHSQHPQQQYIQDYQQHQQLQNQPQEIDGDGDELTK